MPVDHALPGNEPTRHDPVAVQRTDREPVRAAGAPLVACREGVGTCVRVIVVARVVVPLQEQGRVVGERPGGRHVATGTIVRHVVNQQHGESFHLAVDEEDLRDVADGRGPAVLLPVVARKIRAVVLIERTRLQRATFPVSGNRGLLRSLPGRGEQTATHLLRDDCSHGDGIGRVLDALDEHEIASNTLVVFLSDNGCAGYFQGLCSCEPLSGGKLTYYEGGVRVPFVARWPGVISAGSTVSTPVSALDNTPNRARRLQPDRHHRRQRGPRRAGMAQLPNGCSRRGNLKLFKPNQDRPCGYLYDLASDPREQRDLASERPEDVRALETDIADWADDMARPLWGRRPPVTYSICNIMPIGFEN
ncbi:MAG: hypothetical protein CMQ24_04825 [Gammaproteobacteria bacterium]|nr:hypothetical protein [Gammaproteobacteria bacterium]